MTIEEFINVIDTDGFPILLTLNYCGTGGFEEYTRVYFGPVSKLDGHDIPQRYKSCKVLAIHLTSNDEIDADIYD